MPRPKKTRFVSGYPTFAAFIPQGVPVSGEVFLSVEELEAIRLSDFEGLDQETAANMMEISRQTYGRILANARRMRVIFRKKQKLPAYAGPNQLTLDRLVAGPLREAYLPWAVWARITNSYTLKLNWRRNRLWLY